MKELEYLTKGHRGRVETEDFFWKYPAILTLCRTEEEESEVA